MTAIRQIVFLLFPQTHLMDLAGPAQVFYEAVSLGSLPLQIRFVSARESIRSEQGLLFSDLLPATSLALKKGDLICVPGIDFRSFTEGILNQDIETCGHWLIQQHRRGVSVASICSGALILGKMQLLNGVKCTTHWKCFSYAEEKFPRAQWQRNRLYVFDQNIFTSAGMSAGIDMALALVEKWSNALLSSRIAKEMVIQVRRADTHDQEHTFLDFKNHFNPEVYKAFEILSQHLETSYTISDLARELHLSVRQISRLFRMHTGKTVQAFRENLRMEKARQLFLHTQLTYKEIAALCGYQSSRQFTRIWKKYEATQGIKSLR